ncbi:MAG: sulfatase-like hydrolase/transferase [Chitinophagaceae bacterium]|nr:sulfatase-like hydrolase/transferase [Chitinophagaceae bacterium]
MRLKSKFFKVDIETGEISSIILAAVISLFILQSCGGERTALPKNKPNVLIILTDDQEFYEIAKFGGKVLTPNMDRIGTEGVVLDRFYASSPVCTPSRYSMLTGRYASRNQNIIRLFPPDEPAFIRWNADILAGQEKTIAHLLGSAGYSTGMVGKWHLGQPTPELTYQETWNGDLNDPYVAQQVKIFYEGQREYVKYAAGFDYVESLYGNNLHALGLPHKDQLHNMEWVTSGALNFLDQYNPEKTGKPFFLFFSPTPPHIPDGVESMLADGRVTAEGLLDYPIEGVQPPRSDVFRRVKEAGLDSSTAPVTWLDDGIGSVLNRIEQMGQLENTIVIFMSDNGSHRGKMTCYEDAAHMPAMIMWKGKISPGKRNESLMANIDIVPTLLDICRIAKPQDYKVDGLSLKEALLNDKPLNRDFLYLEVVYQRGIVTKDWKYLATRFPQYTEAMMTPEIRKHYSIEGRPLEDRYQAETFYPSYFADDQLFNISDDPKEQKNLASDPAYKEKMNEMRKHMKQVVSTLHNSFGEFKGE